MAQSLTIRKKYDDLLDEGKAAPAPRPVQQQFSGSPRKYDFLTDEHTPLVSGESTFLKVLDAINLPQQALFGLLTRRPDESLLSSAERGARQNLSFGDVLDVVGEAVPETKGALQQSVMLPMLSAKLPSEIGQAPPESTVRNVIGFAGDLALDPLNALPGKAIAKPLELAGKGVATAGRVGLELLPKPVFERGIKPLAQAFSKTAFRTEAEKQVIEIIDQVQGEMLRDRVDILDRAIDNDKFLGLVARKAGVSKEQARQTVASLIEQKTPHPQMKLPGVVEDIEAGNATRAAAADDLDLEKTIAAGRKAAGQMPLDVTLQSAQRSSIQQAFKEVEEAVADLRKNAPTDLRQGALELKQQIENTFAREMRAGVMTHELDDAKLDYVLHLMTPEARRVAERLPQFVAGGFREFSPAHASQIARELRGLSIREINELAAKGKLPGFENKFIRQFMVEDPTALVAVRELRAAKAIADLEVLNRATSQMGIPTNFSPRHWVELSITKSTDPRLMDIGSGMKGIAFDPDVAKHLNAVIEKSITPTGLSSFLRLYDTAQGVWKGITLAIFPSYHTRNAVGNAWNNYLAGLSDQTWYATAGKLMHGGDTGAMKLAGREFERWELRQLLDDYGIANRGFMASEIPQDLRKIGKIGRSVEAERIPVVGPAVRKGFEVGTAIENNARVAHFLWRLDAGDLPIQAARSVKKYLFDYSTGLTDFEKSVMRRIFPFYSWTRFNVPLQARALVENPRPFIRLAEVVRTARQEEPEFRDEFFHQRILPDFIKKNSGIPVRVDEDGNPEYFLLGGWLPAADLEALSGPDAVMDKAVALLSPFIKEPIEQLTNTDLFLRRKIEEFPGEKQKFLGADVRRRLAHLAKNIRVFGELDSLLRAAYDKELTDDELTRVSAVTRLLFGLKGYKVDVGRQLKRVKFEDEEVKRKIKNFLRRGDDANADILMKRLREEPE